MSVPLDVEYDPAKHCVHRTALDEPAPWLDRRRTFQDSKVSWGKTIAFFLNIFSEQHAQWEQHCKQPERLHNMSLVPKDVEYEPAAQR